MSQITVGFPFGGNRMYRRRRHLAAGVDLHEPIPARSIICRAISTPRTHGRVPDHPPQVPIRAPKAMTAKRFRRLDLARRRSPISPCWSPASVGLLLLRIVPFSRTWWRIHSNQRVEWPCKTDRLHDVRRDESYCTSRLCVKTKMCISVAASGLAHRVSYA